MDEVHSPGEIASLVRLAEHLEGQVMPWPCENANTASETLSGACEKDVSCPNDRMDPGATSVAA